MKMLEVPRIASTDTKAPTGYYLKEREGTFTQNFCYRFTRYIYPFAAFLDPTFFPGRAATIYYRPPAEEASTISSIKNDVKATLGLGVARDQEIGLLGILHPTVLEKFEILYPCSAVEFTLEPFKKEMQTVWTNAD